MKKKINLLLALLFIFSIFFISYLYRQNNTNDIEKHSLYTVGKIIKFSRTLKSGDYWDYEFKYKWLRFKGSKSTHVDYNVKIGDKFLVNFSSQNPNHSRIFYRYKLNPGSLENFDTVWSKIPDIFFENQLLNE